MKKILSLVLVLAVLFSFGLFALGSGSSDDEGTADQGSGNAAATEQDNTTLGDYSVEIKSCRLAKDFADKDVVIVTYNFTNVNDDDPTAFYIAFEDTVFQGGVGLNEAYILADDANYSADNQTKEIKKGASLEVEVAYELNDTTTDVEVEVKELISFSDKVLKKTFTIAQ